MTELLVDAELASELADRVLGEFPQGLNELEALAVHHPLEEAAEIVVRQTNEVLKPFRRNSRLAELVLLARDGVSPCLLYIRGHDYVVERR